MSDADTALPDVVRVTIDYTLEHHDDGRVTVHDPDGYMLTCGSLEAAVIAVREIITAGYSSGLFHVEAIRRLL